MEPLALAWYGYVQLAHPDRVRNAARQVTEHHGVPPLDEGLDYQPTEGRPVISG